MGNAQSGMVYRKISRELPPVKRMGHDENWKYMDLGMKVFSDEKDREQFICKHDAHAAQLPPLRVKVNEEHYADVEIQLH